jgi:hypothetical protein
MNEHKSGILAVKELIAKYCKDAGKYVYKLTSNVVESINNVRTKYASKAYHHDKSYPGKNAEAILQFENPHL